MSNAKFNRSHRPRSSWQSDPHAIRHFVMSAPVFAQKTPFNGQDDPLPYELHPWILAALKDKLNLVANPKKPSVLAFESDELRTVEDSALGELTEGNIIWVSFTVAYAIGRKDWHLEIRPIELVQVGCVIDPGPSITDASAYAETERAPLRIGRVSLLNKGASILIHVLVWTNRCFRTV